MMLGSKLKVIMMVKLDYKLELKLVIGMGKGSDFFQRWSQCENRRQCILS